MRPTLTTAVLMSAVLAAGPAWSASVTAVNGTVLINRGDGFKPVIGTVEANAGDSVTANPGATGQVVYADGCPAAINPGSVITISAQSPCQAYAQQQPQTVPPPLGPPPIPPLLLAVGVIGAVAGAVVLINNQASP